MNITMETDYGRLHLQWDEVPEASYRVILEEVGEAGERLDLLSWEEEYPGTYGEDYVAYYCQEHGFPQQIAFNCIAEIGSYNENGYTAEEMKMQNEGRRILHLPDLKVTCTCVRVPVYRSHSISFTAVTEDKVTVGQARDAIMNAEGTKLVEDHVPSPLETSNQDIVYVGRIREDLCEENGLAMWCCGDQIRKGAAANAVQIMEYLLSH